MDHSAGYLGRAVAGACRRRFFCRRARATGGNPASLSRRAELVLFRARRRCSFGCGLFQYGVRPRRGAAALCRRARHSRRRLPQNGERSRDTRYRRRVALSGRLFPADHRRHRRSTRLIRSTTRVRCQSSRRRDPTDRGSASLSTYLGGPFRCVFGKRALGGSGCICSTPTTNLTARPTAASLAGSTTPRAKSASYRRLSSGSRDGGRSRRSPRRSRSVT